MLACWGVLWHAVCLGRGGGCNAGVDGDSGGGGMLAGCAVGWEGNEDLHVSAAVLGHAVASWGAGATARCCRGVLPTSAVGIAVCRQSSTDLHVSAAVGYALSSRPQGHCLGWALLRYC